MAESTSKVPQGNPGQVDDPGAREQQSASIDVATDQAADPAVEHSQEREHSYSTPEAVVRSKQPGYLVGDEPDISELLMDLSLPNEYLQLLLPCISHLQLNLSEQQQIRNRLTNQTHLFTLISNGWDNRCLLLIPDKVITDPQPVNIFYLKDLIELLFDHFNKRMKLIIVHESNLDAKYEDFLNLRMARQLKLTIKYLPCSHLRDIREWALEDQVEHLTFRISLDDLEESKEPADVDPKKLAISEMSTADRRELTSILAGLDSFKNDKDRRRILAQMVGLNTDNFDFDGKELSVAWNLITLCLSTGFMPEENRHALELLMTLIKEDGGLNTNDRNMIDTILSQYK
jgi:hypothetical protein